MQPFVQTVVLYPSCKVNLAWLALSDFRKISIGVTLLGLPSLISIVIFYSIPERYESLRKEVDSAKQLWKNRQELRVEDAGIAVLFGLECFAWFCAGEIVGRGFTFTGYQV